MRTTAATRTEQEKKNIKKIRRNIKTRRNT